MTDAIIPGFARTPYELSSCPDGHAYLAVTYDGLRGWTASRTQAMEVGKLVVQRVMRGPRKGSEWTVKKDD